MIASPARRLVLAIAAAGLLAGTLPGAARGAEFADAPFWASRPDAAGFAKINQDRIAAARAAIDRLLAVQGPRTIENTLVPYDEALAQLDMAAAQSSLIENVHPDSALRAAAEQSSQKTSAYGSEVSLNPGVYAALSALDLSGADEETRFYVERELRDFRLAGVDRDEATRAKVRALRDTLVRIGQEWQRNIRADVRSIQVDPAELGGLPKDFLDSHPPGPDGKVSINTTYPDYQPVMNYCTSDAVRRRLFMEFQNRAHPGNVDVLRRMATVRSELAGLLGYANWADYITANKMAANGRTVREFIDRIASVSGAAQERDYGLLLARKRKDAPGATAVELWESGYWSELVRRSDYDFDSQSIRPYLPFARVQQGVLELTGRLFGVTFRRVPDAPVWHPSVECYEMLEGERLAGRIYLDMHPRPNKYGHAAQFDIRTGIAGRQLPEAALVCNLPGGSPDDPGLCTIEDVRTMLHEFGHLLHTLFAGQRRWLGTSGIRTEHDFVEAPSQMLEEWLRDPKTLQTFALHHETGEPVPAGLVGRMNRAQGFARGIGVRRQMMLADFSLSVYSRDPAKTDFDALAAELAGRYTPYPRVEGTHWYCAFSHLDGYSAVYYTYMWSLVIAKDLFGAFDRERLLDPETSMRYRRTILAAGGSAPAGRLVERFLGRPFGFEAYERWMNESR